MIGYVIAGWGAAVVVLSLYGWRTVRRGKILVRSLPDGEKPWR